MGAWASTRTARDASALCGRPHLNVDGRRPMCAAVQMSKGPAWSARRPVNSVVLSGVPPALAGQPECSEGLVRCLLPASSTASMLAAASPSSSSAGVRASHGATGQARRTRRSWRSPCTAGR
eukprot:4633084-Prymnesium_polylepis.1